MKLDELGKTNFEQIIDVKEIPLDILKEIIKLDGAISEEDIKRIDTDKELSKNDLLNVSRYSSNNHLLEIYNKFLTQFIDLDEETKNFLKTKLNNKKYSVSFNKFVNYTTFKVILEDIVKENNDLEDIQIYNSTEYMSVYGKVDYQVVIKTKQNKTIIFGLKLSKQENGNNTFVPITLDNHGDTRDFNSIESDINKGIKSKNLRTRNLYNIFIENIIQKNINKTVIGESLNINKSSDLGENGVAIKIRNDLQKIVNREIEVLEKGQGYVDIIEENKDEFTSLIEYLEELSKQKDKLLNERKKIKSKRDKRKISGKEKNKDKEYNNKPNLNKELQNYLNGKLELEELLVMIGEENYKKYNSIVNIWKDRKEKKEKNGLVSLKISKNMTRSVTGDILERFKELKKFAIIKLEEKKISDLLNKNKLKIEDKIEVLKSIQMNFESIFLSENTYRNFNRHFSFNKLVTLKYDDNKKELLLYLRFLKELDVDNDIDISLEDIEKIRVGELNLRDYKNKSKTETLRELLKIDKKTLEIKFKIFQKFLDKKEISDVSVNAISKIINDIFSNISANLLAKNNYPTVYKKNFLEIISKVNNKVKNSGKEINFEKKDKFNSLEDFLNHYIGFLDRRIEKENKEEKQIFDKIISSRKKTIEDKIYIIDYILDNDIILTKKDFEGLNSFLDENGLNRLKSLDDSRLKITKLELFKKIKELKEKVDNNGKENLDFTFPQIQRFIIKFDVSRILGLLKLKQKKVQDRIDILNYYLIKDDLKINGEDLGNINFVINSYFKNNLKYIDIKENVVKKEELLDLIEKIYNKIGRIEGMNLSFYKKREDLLDFLEIRRKKLKN